MNCAEVICDSTCMAYRGDPRDNAHPACALLEMAEVVAAYFTNRAGSVKYPTSPPPPEVTT